MKRGLRVPEDLPEAEKAAWMIQHRAQVIANYLTWLAVHGNLCLALRHPENRGASRRYVVDFVKGLGKMLVAAGVMTEAQMKAAWRLEVEEGSRDLA